MISQGESLHEVAQITVIHEVQRGSSMSGWSLDAAGVMPEGTPVALSFGDSVNAALYYGYVTSVSVKGSDFHQSATSSVQVPVVYTCIGPTYHMQSQVNRLWSSATASYIARTITRSAGLRPQVQQGSRLFETIPQRATSDFTFLRDLADEVGYRMTPRGTTIAFTDPLVSLRETGEDLPAFQYARHRGDTVKTWKSTAGQLDPLGGMRTRREGYSFNSATGALVRVVAEGTQDATVTQYSTGRPFTTQAEASEILAAEVRRERLWVHAEATVLGDARVRPGTELEVAGSALGPNDSGLWMVRSTTHRISVTPNQPASGVYWTDTTLGRNRIDGLDSILKAGRVGEIPPGTTLIDGRWRAQHVGRA
ncbi:hypothetical protein [Streptomyces sp. RTd22]|uniref:hypothetical protein n=1 Tax=Streptomyces sp. RTd22 TaxID=1841249 RepID=UPI0007C4FDF6|nr:hypothetical protein [Streptomyces sp. RTd22]